MLLFPIIDYSMPKENKEDRDEEAQAAISDTGKDIKKGMDRYETRTKSAVEGGGGGEAQPAGDSTRSEE
jgi:hypothetical protein